MFTGLVQVLGQVEDTVVEGKGQRFVLHWPALKEPLELGESVAENGCCLTVVETHQELFTVQAGPETLIRTNLGEQKIGSAVNLERALRLSDRLGGHFVQGHVDCVATLVERKPEGEWDFLKFQLDPAWTLLLVEKGSICVDGVSLTVVNLENDWFSVMLIPHTLSVTTLGRRKPGDRVNIETDLLAKHVRQLLRRGGEG